MLPGSAVRTDAWIDCVLISTQIDPAAVIMAGLLAARRVFQSTATTVVARYSFSLRHR
jgi:hypothetical protein